MSRRPWLLAVIWAGGLAFLFTSLMITAEVLLRRLFNASMAGADELSGYVMAGASAWAFAYAALVNGHVRIDSVLQFAPRRVMAVFDVLAQMTLCAFAGVLTYFAAGVLLFSIENESRSQTPLGVPLWVPQLVWVSGLAAFTLVTGAMGAIAAGRLLRGRWTAASDLLRSRELEHEIAEAVAWREDEAGR